MATRTTRLDDRLHDYLLSYGIREPEALRELREATETHPKAMMQIAPEQGQFMRMLVALLDARRVLEIGTFTGYSALSFALALPAGGTVVTCDINREWTNTAQAYWQKAGVEDRIELRLGPAAETLEALLREHGGSTYDIAFIDADKESYDLYYERCLELVRPGGLILIDNMFWDGAVADPEQDDEETEALRGLARKIHADNRVDISLVPIGDGLMLARRRESPPQKG